MDMATKFFKLLFLTLLVTSTLASAQVIDSLIYAEGKIVRADTKEPITARITYQSLPYGNKIGTLKTTNYSFPMFDNERYSIVVEAPGFAPAKYLLDPTEANEQKKVVKDIELQVGVPLGGHSVGHVMRLNNLIFQLGRSKISPESYDELGLIVNMMQENSTMIIQLEGHTDYQGNARDNMKLSKERVDAVKGYLVSKGINKQRIKTKAFGGTMPLSKENAPEAHRLNRRVELRILQN
jgi:outer membrane protein OmpA-like peptidoglycan-associated protein